MYDLVAVLGLKLNDNWEITDDLRARLDKAAEIYFDQKTKHILVSGRWSIWNDWLKIKPPITETKAMKSYLLELGVPKESIITENYSKDTIGNIFGIAKIYPKYYKSVAIICAQEHVERVKILCEDIITSTKGISYIQIAAPNFDDETTGTEKEMIIEQRQVVKDLVQRRKKNPHYRIYSHPYYTNQAKKVRSV